jgi:hypothetical protein
MEIDINQQKISIGDKYKIFIDGQQTHTASREIFNLIPVVNLFKLNNERPRMRIEQLFAFFKARYELKRSDNNVDVELLVSFCLLIDNYANDDHDNKLFSIDFGNLLFQARKFDPAWQPK